jgi:hypothetical protein
MKFVLFCEGHTERKALPEFLKRWLDVRLPTRVGIKPVRFDGWRELVSDSPKKARMYLEDPDVIAVIALLDLYGPNIYPPSLTKADDKYAWAKKDLEGKVNHARFRQFFAVHETEAWLLADLSLFTPKISKSLIGKKPETVNFNCPPAKLLNQIYLHHLNQTYKKVTHGQALFRKLDPNIAYEQCPHLKEILDEMLLLAQKKQS